MATLIFIFFEIGIFALFAFTLSELIPKRKKTIWITTGCIFALLLITAPRTTEEFGHEKSKYYKVDNCGIISTCSEKYGGRWNVVTEEYENGNWRVTQIGILGAVIDVD